MALQAMRLSRFLGGVLFVGLIHNPVEAFGTTLPAMSSVTLVWDGSPSSDVTSYRVYYGGASRNYTNNTTVGRQSSGQ